MADVRTSEWGAIGLINSCDLALSHSCTGHTSPSAKISSRNEHWAKTTGWLTPTAQKRAGQPLSLHLHDQPICGSMCGKRRTGCPRPPNSFQSTLTKCLPHLPTHPRWYGYVCRNLCLLIIWMGGIENCMAMLWDHRMSLIFISRAVWMDHSRTTKISGATNTASFTLYLSIECRVWMLHRLIRS